MEILKWKFSEKITNYLKQLNHLNTNNIIYFHINEHPNINMHNHKGCTFFDNDTVKVFLNPMMETDLAEETACHEIEHIELIFSGFNYVAFPEKHHQNDSRWDNLCININSTFSDLLIDKKLAKIGYDQEEFRNCLFEDTLKVLVNMRKDIINFLPVQYGNALGVCRTAITLNRVQWKELKKAYIKNTAKEYNLGIKVLQQVHKIGFYSPNKYFELLRSIIKVFNIEKEVYLYNLITKQRLE